MRLLASQRLIAQLLGLERNTSRGGKDSIDHARGGHDDVANAAAGALLTALAKRPQMRTSPLWYAGLPGPNPNKQHGEPLRLKYIVVDESGAVKTLSC